MYVCVLPNKDLHSGVVIKAVVLLNTLSSYEAVVAVAQPIVCNW